MTPTPTEQEARDAFAHGAGHVTFESMRQCANAWLTVAAKLHEVAPGWMSRPGTGAECALEAIAALTRKEAQPEDWYMRREAHAKEMGYVGLAHALDDLERRRQQEAQGAVAWMRSHPTLYGGRPFPSDVQLADVDTEDGWTERPLIYGDTAPPAPVNVRDPATLARRFHETYERLAPQFGYETRVETRAFDPDSANGKLMIATCAALLNGQPAGVDWRGHFVSTTEARYRDAGMKVEQARIHAENDARGLEAMHQAALGSRGDRKTNR